LQEIGEKPVAKKGPPILPPKVAKEKILSPSSEPVFPKRTSLPSEILDAGEKEQKAYDLGKVNRYLEAKKFESLEADFILRIKDSPEFSSWAEGHPRPSSLDAIASWVKSLPAYEMKDGKIVYENKVPKRPESFQKMREGLTQSVSEAVRERLDRKSDPKSLQKEVLQLANRLGLGRSREFLETLQNVFKQKSSEAKGDSEYTEEIDEELDEVVELESKELKELPPPLPKAKKGPPRPAPKVKKGTDPVSEAARLISQYGIEGDAKWEYENLILGLIQGATKGNLSADQKKFYATHTRDEASRIAEEHGLGSDFLREFDDRVIEKAFGKESTPVKSEPPQTSTEVSGASIPSFNKTTPMEEVVGPEILEAIQSAYPTAKIHSLNLKVSIPHTVFALSEVTAMLEAQVPGENKANPNTLIALHFENAENGSHTFIVDTFENLADNNYLHQIFTQQSRSTIFHLDYVAQEGRVHLDFIGMDPKLRGKKITSQVFQNFTRHLSKDYPGATLNAAAVNLNVIRLFTKHLESIHGIQIGSNETSQYFLDWQRPIDPALIEALGYGLGTEGALTPEQVDHLNRALSDPAHRYERHNLFFHYLEQNRATAFSEGKTQAKTEVEFLLEKMKSLPQLITHTPEGESLNNYGTFWIEG
jgi:hypothetical protein